MTLPHALRVEVWGSTFVSALGAWLLAGRFSRSPALRAFVAIVYAINGRWTLQITSGHTWHLAYAWTPWVLYFYERAVGDDPSQGRPPTRDLVLCGACLAIMVYSGGIYPLPQTIFTIALYACLLAAVARSWRPVSIAMLCGILSFGFAAPKLLPMIEVILKYPRLTDSPETLTFSAFLDILTSKDQEMTSFHPGVSQWGWHEWGMYIGWSAVGAGVAGILLGRGARESPLKWTGLCLLALGFGSFAELAPWPLLRHLPIFKSEHVPSRWMVPGMLLLLLVATSLIERALRRVRPVRPWLEIALAVAVAWAARDVASVTRQTLTHAFPVKMPAEPESMGPFRTEIHVPPELVYAYDWAPMLLSTEMANVGTIDCSTFPAFNNYIRGQNGRTPGLGAHGRGDPAYKGEVFVPDGAGEATITRWTPNEVTVEVRGARPGEHLVLNQNWDPNWTVNGVRAVEWAEQVAAPLGEAEETFVFRYRSRLLWPGLILFVATWVAVVWAHWRARKPQAVPHVPAATSVCTAS
jgi:hypothetical protein